MANDGRKYELFVARLQQALLSAENVAEQKNILVEVNKKIIDNCGIEREFDIYWEYEFGGLTYKTVIECKDYNSRVSVERIDALLGKTKDLPDLRAVFATKKGYQSGAKAKADLNKIDLLVVREQNESDWTDADGTPLLKKVCITMNLCMPARIRSFEPTLDVAWIKENTDIDTSLPLEIAGLNNEIFIDDAERNRRFSLHDIEHTLSPPEGKEHGIFEKSEKFNNAFIQYKDIKLRILAYRVEYSVSKPLIDSIEIDFSKELVGVIEYLQKGTKKSIFRNGIVR